MPDRIDLTSDALIDALELCRGNRSAAAALLEVSTATFRRRMAEYPDIHLEIAWYADSNRVLADEISNHDPLLGKRLTGQLLRYKEHQRGRSRVRRLTKAQVEAFLVEASSHRPPAP